MPSGVTIKLDDADFKKALLRFYVSQRKSWPEVIRSQGRLIAVNLAFQTQPFGNDEGRTLGEGKVRSDIFKVYAAPGQVYKKIKEQSESQAKAFWSLLKKGKFQSAKTFLSRLGISEYEFAEIGYMDKGESHKNAKRSIPYRTRISRNQKPFLIVADTKKLDPYITLISKRVGMTKSGWATCAKILGGTRGIPQWVTRHASKVGKGYVMDRTSGENPYVILVNEIPWVDKCLNEGQMQRALDIQKEKMIRATDIAMQKQAKAMGF